VQPAANASAEEGGVERRARRQATELPANDNSDASTSIIATVAATNESTIRVIAGPPSHAAHEQRSDVAVRQGAARIGAPSSEAERASDPGPGASGDSAVVHVDALVGQINGRPVFASSFLAPMDARLRAEAKRVSAKEWLQFARREISRALQSKIVNELLLAEAKASLTPEQRKGLLSFVEQFRDSLVSQNAGSEQIAKRTIQQEEGLSLEGKAQEMLDQELLRMQLRKALADNAQVSWRDVEIEYERRNDEFNPPPTIVLRMIRAPSDDTERIARITADLATKAPFADIARQESDWNREAGGLYPRSGAFQLDASTIAESNVFGPKPLNDAAHTLAKGATAGPVNVGADTYWLFLENVSQTSTSLFEAQLTILSQLRAQRLQEAEQAYLDKLIGRGSVTNIKQMQDRLFQFAVERYLLRDRS